MFKERESAKTKVEAVQAFMPIVLISSTALTKMQTYVEQCSDEIGWLGTATRTEGKNNDIYFVEDTYLFDQEVHATTTEITPEGLAEFAEEILQLDGDEGLKIWNNLRMWGHSHVNMGVTPSGQDDTQMETFKEGGNPWFLRIIANKKGELKIDLYDYEKSIVYLDLPWVEKPEEEEMKIRAKIDKLEQQLDELASKRLSEHEEEITKEMEEKVRKKSYITTSYAGKKNTTAGSHHLSVVSGAGSESNVVYSHYGHYGHYDYQPDYEKNPYGYTYNYANRSIFKHRRDVEDYFTPQYLVALADYANIDDLEGALYEAGYTEVFSMSDLYLIRNIANEYANEFTSEI